MESEDQNGRTSLRRIVSNDREGRSSIIHSINDCENPGSARSGPSLRFIRKSELSQDLFSNKSVISIKQDGGVSFKYGASE